MHEDHNADGWDDIEWDDEPGETPPLDRYYDIPDPDRTWVHPDGHLHEAPPLPVARVSYEEAGYQLPIFGGVGWWPAIEAPACGAVLDIPGAITRDGQRRRFKCDRRVGHTDRGHEPEQHRCVVWDPTRTGGACIRVWTEETVKSVVAAVQAAGS